MSTEKLVGRFVSEYSENMDAYLKETGCGTLVRKAVANTEMTINILNQGDQWSCFQEHTFKSPSVVFKLNEEFEQMTPERRMCKTMVTLTPEGKLVERQRKKEEYANDHTITRYLEDEDTLVVVYECGNVSAKRVFRRQKCMCTSDSINDKYI
ncbi:hypothetical protein PMAYCL1PPCAC_04761 [Pristionchus mayeri]|uniref:Lipocalin/cytosolic fatty-acid binding domain-containing protein n=1 Tax=Pristionchus mayeri TaxID=1317129 RepID=A0AAN5CB22_9BILA|nr:hypothetical protein PMAYCL1PPCAC_04761 [Pristionchus mayeri]